MQGKCNVTAKMPTPEEVRRYAILYVAKLYGGPLIHSRQKDQERLTWEQLDSEGLATCEVYNYYYKITNKAKEWLEDFEAKHPDIKKQIEHSGCVPDTANSIAERLEYEEAHK